MEPRADFLLRHLVPAAAFALLLLALDRTGIDSAVSGWFFDAAARTFPLRHNGMLEVLGHQWARGLVIVTAGSVVVMFLLSFVLPLLRPYRRLLLFLALALVLAPLTVRLLKASSTQYCPWRLREFGGLAPHLSLFDAAPPGLAPGHCFPSGHASAGFALLAFYFAGFHLGNRRLAHAGLWGGITAGTVFGIVRVAQGAHFLSHNLWSGLVCWLVILALYVAIMGMPGRHGGEDGLMVLP